MNPHILEIPEFSRSYKKSQIWILGPVLNQSLQSDHQHKVHLSNKYPRHSKNYSNFKSNNFLLF